MSVVTPSPLEELPKPSSLRPERTAPLTASVHDSIAPLAVASSRFAVSGQFTRSTCSMGRQGADGAAGPAGTVAGGGSGCSGATTTPAPAGPLPLSSCSVSSDKTLAIGIMGGGLSATAAVAGETRGVAARGARRSAEAEALGCGHRVRARRLR